MTILTDDEIEERCLASLPKPMISPFYPYQVRYEDPDTKKPVIFMPGDEPMEGDPSVERIISYGLSSHGYDIRLQPRYKVFTSLHGETIDPRNMSDKCYVEMTGPRCLIPPNSYILGLSVEKFAIPRNIMGICMGKSTYARCASIVNVTPLEAGWEGHLVIEIANTSTLPLVVYADMGIAQVFFLRSEKDCRVSYADRLGKYQNQQGIQGAIL